MRNSVHFLLSLCAGFVAAALPTRAAEPRVEWQFETKGKIYASPIIADLDANGIPEVIVCASRDKRVICLNGQGDLVWDYRIHDWGGDGLQATPSAVDMDGDGGKEVFFVDTGGVAGCLDAFGKLIWRIFTGDHVDYSGPVVADVDSDGRIEVIFGSDSGTLYCLDDCGMQKWHYQGDGQIRGIPAVATDPSTGTMRMYTVFGAGVAACFDSEGRVVWSHNEPSARKERRSGPALGDVDGDGQLEVVLATDDFQVIVRDAFTGDEKWRWKGRVAIDQTNSFALADFDGSGQLDIVCADGGGLGGPGNVYRLRDGRALWSADVGGGVVQGPSIGDVDGDGDLEILVCSRSNRLICLSSSGNQEWAFPSQAGSLTTPAVGDVDGDGEVEIVFTSKDRFVYCVSVGGTYDPARLPWPMINHDPQLSGNAQGAPFSPPAPLPPMSPHYSLMVDKFGPLWVGDNEVVVKFANATSRRRHLEAVAEVSRPAGGMITQTVNAQLDPLEERTVRLTVPAHSDTQIGPAATYTLNARLVDVGTGETLAKQRKELVFHPWAEERREIKTQAMTILNQLSQLTEESAQARGVAAFTGLLLGEPSLSDEEAMARLESLTKENDVLFVQALEETAERLCGLPPEAPVKRQKQAAAAVAQMLRGLRRIGARARAGAITPSEALDFAVVPETPLRKVFRDEPYLDAAAEPCSSELSLARNEYESIQFVVVPLWRDIPDLHVSVSELKHADSDARISAADVEVHRVGYVTIGPSEYNWFVEKQGDYPDILFPNAPIHVPADQDAQPFFVTVHTHADTPPGDYAGEVVFEAEGCQPISVPLHVHVWAFALTDETHLKTSMWMNESWLQRFYKYDGRTPFEVRKRFYNLHLTHRVGPVKDFPLGGGDMTDDFEYLIANGQNNFFIHVPEWLEETDRPTHAEKMLATHALLTERGWNDLAMFYTRDEVAVMARHLIPKVVEMNTWIHSVVPDWPRLQTSAPEQPLFGAVDIWCPTIDSFDPVLLKERMAQGDRLWFYTVWGRPGIMIEFPATDHRLMFWECWKYGAEGFLYWGTTHWDLNTTTGQRWPDIPWIPYNRQPGHNGCGYLIYPGPNGTPFDSIRFAAVRDGIEDYEYLFMLRALLQAAGDKCPTRLARGAEAELRINPDVLVDHKTFTEDPGAILAARERIATLITEIQALTP